MIIRMTTAAAAAAAAAAATAAAAIAEATQSGRVRSGHTTFTRRFARDGARFGGAIRPKQQLRGRPRQRLERIVYDAQYDAQHDAQHDAQYHAQYDARRKRCAGGHGRWHARGASPARLDSAVRALLLIPHDGLCEWDDHQVLPALLQVR
jgi:hypothetical protein